MDHSALSSRALIAACLDTGDSLAWHEFIRRFQKLIATVALRTALRWGVSAPQDIDELVQETYLKLCADNCRLLRSFQSFHDDAIFGYVKVLTANLVHDHLKASRAQKRGGSTVIASIDCDSPATFDDRDGQSSVQVENRILMTEIAACLETAVDGLHAARDRRIFWFYYRVGLSASAIAALPNIGLSTKGVESTILRLTREVRTQLTKHSETKPSADKSVRGIRPAESL